MTAKTYINLSTQLFISLYPVIYLLETADKFVEQKRFHGNSHNETLLHHTLLTLTLIGFNSTLGLYSGVHLESG